MAAITENQKTTILEPVDTKLELAFSEGVTSPGPVDYLPAVPLYGRVRAKDKVVTRDWVLSVLASLVSTMGFDQPGLGTAAAPVVIPIGPLSDGGSPGSITVVGGLVVDRVDPTQGPV